EGQTQQSEPPRRACGRLFLGGDLEQQPCRREIDTARPRWDEAEQPPQHGQAEQAKQDQRLRKPERQRSDHAALAEPAVICRLLTTSGCLLSPMRECSVSRSSLAGRS